jgi:hypothetical protein
MTKQQARRFACAWIAADLESHLGVGTRFHNDRVSEMKIEAAYGEIIEEMKRRAGSAYIDARGPNADWMGEPVAVNNRREPVPEARCNLCISGCSYGTDGVFHHHPYCRRYGTTNRDGKSP